jgi:hypothetical protein
MIFLDAVTNDEPENLDGQERRAPVCVGCTRPALGDGADIAGPRHDRIDIAVGVIGGLAAVGGLAAALTGREGYAKIGAGVGVVGALALLGLAAYRAHRISEETTAPVLAPLHTVVGDIGTDVLLAGGIMAASAVALLLAARS